MKMADIKIQGQQLNKFAKPKNSKADRGYLSPIKSMSMASSNSMPTFKGGFAPKGDFTKHASEIFKKIFVKDIDTVELSGNVVRNLDGIFDNEVSRLIKKVQGIPEGVKTPISVQFNKAGDELTSIKFEEAPIITRLFKKIIYPIYPGLIKDLPNAIIDGLQNFKVFKNSKTLNAIKDSKFLSSRRIQLESDKMTSSLYGILKKEQTLKLKGKPIDENMQDFYLKMFGGSRGNYSNQSERALNALATTLVSGVFSSVDFYNTSRFHHDDDKKAQKAQKGRFAYEVRRGVLKALACFATAGALSKYTNANKTAAVLNLMLTTFTIETVSRLMSGKSLLPISKKKAIEKYYEQNGKQGETLQQFEEMNQDDIEKFVSSKNPIKKYAEVAKNENIAFKENDQNLIKANDKQEEKGKGLLTKFLMVVGGIALLGVGKAGLIKFTKGGEGFFKGLSQGIQNISDKLSVHEYKMDETTVNKMLAKLRESGKNNFANMFEESLRGADGKINYSVKTKGLWYARFLNPVQALLDIVKKPFSIGEKLGKKLFRAEYDVSAKGVKTNEKAFEIYKKLTKNTSGGRELVDNFDDKVSKIITNGFNINTSILDTRELVRKYVFFNTLIPSYFFVNDYRNEELIQSKGENTDRVKEVTEKRIMHRIVNYFSNRVFIELFFALTGNAFNSSLLAATAITAATEATNETVIRKIIGVPLGKKSKAEIEKFEEEHSKNKFFMFFKNLLGKKNITEKAGKTA